MLKNRLFVRLSIMLKYNIMIEKQSIFLTGGSGLLALNWFYSKRKDYNIFLGLNKRIVKPIGGHVVSVDFSSLDNFIKQLKSIGPSMVVHTASLTNVEKCQNSPDLAYQINVELSKIVAIATKRLGIKMVHISTDHLFDGNHSLVTEDICTKAVNMYGETKSLAEKVVMQHNSDALIIRTNFYAWGTSYRKSFSDIIIQALRQNQEVFLFDDVHYSPILAENLIQTVHDLIEKKARGIYHVVSDDRISKYDFGILLAEEFGLEKSNIQKCSLLSKPNLVIRPFDMSLSNKKVRDLLGRNLGSVKMHITQLHQQEIQNKITEIQLL